MGNLLIGISIICRNFYFVLLSQYICLQLLNTLNPVMRYIDDIEIKQDGSVGTESKTISFSSDLAEASSEFKSLKDSNEVIETQPRAQEIVTSAGDRGLKLNFFPLTNRLESALPSLELLEPLSSVLISQIFESDESSNVQGGINKYVIKDSNQVELFTANEQSAWFERLLFGNSRTFTVTICDEAGEQIIKVRRPASCSMCITPFQYICPCFNKIYVSAPPGLYAGSVHWSWSFFRTTFLVKDFSDQTVYRIQGRKVKFDILDVDGKVVGSIQPECNTDPVRAMYAEYQHFSIQFPEDATVKMKAVLIGAVLLIDFVFFEKDKKVKTLKYDGIQRATIIGV